jgi:hypothetical protein
MVHLAEVLPGVRKELEVLAELVAEATEAVAAVVLAAGVAELSVQLE